jgi:hypothetical protein
VAELARDGLAVNAQFAGDAALRPARLVRVRMPYAEGHFELIRHVASPQGSCRLDCQRALKPATDGRRLIPKPTWRSFPLASDQKVERAANAWELLESRMRLSHPVNAVTKRYTAGKTEMQTQYTIHPDAQSRTETTIHQTKQAKRISKER